jgi:hypothetical protein
VRFRPNSAATRVFSAKHAAVQRTPEPITAEEVVDHLVSRLKEFEQSLGENERVEVVALHFAMSVETFHHHGRGLPMATSAR